MNLPSPSFQTPIKGSILLASPSLIDGVFDRTVIYMHKHDEENGSEGFILNRPTGDLVGSKLCSPEFKQLSNIPIYYGGPVDTDKLSFSSFKLSANVSDCIDCVDCISAEQAAQDLRTSGTIVRAFIGKSAWTKGQLADEIENHAWYLAPAVEPALTLAQDNTLWKNTLQHLSPFHHVISLTPENPFLN